MTEKEAPFPTEMLLKEGANPLKLTESFSSEEEEEKEGVMSIIFIYEDYNFKTAYYLIEKCIFRIPSRLVCFSYFHLKSTRYQC